MSLLLDALKKAEKAKDDAKRRSEPEPAERGAPTYVRTRNDLPDISQHLEIHSEDIPGAAGASASEAAAPGGLSFSRSDRTAERTSESFETPRNGAEGQAPRRPRAAREDSGAQDAQAAQRAAAKSVFEAKFREPNPKLPFYIAMALLGVFAVGTAVYFWYQLRPPPALVNSNPKPPSGEQKVETAASKPAPAAAPAVQEPVSAPLISGLPAPAPEPVRPAAPGPAARPAAGSPVASPAAPPPAAVKPAPQSSDAPTRTARETSAAPAPVAQAPRRRTATTPPQTQEARVGTSAPTDPARLSVNRAAAQVHPKLEAGWVAYNQGNLQAARANYQDVLREEPMNRDGLLGMAAIEVRAGRLGQAEILYQRLLETDPRDAYAQAGLFALRAQMSDPVQTESRAKSILAGDPQAYVLHFTLGNQYAQQGRWPEAQQAFFKAFSADPENPDFAYNLAVSLDHLRQPGLALEYYRRAIALAQQRSSNFDQTLARNRVQELAR